MADLTVSADVDTFMGAANFAAMRTALGVPGLATANTFTGVQTLSAAGAASTPGLTLTGLPYTAGTATTNKPHLLIEPTGAVSTAWSTFGTMLGVNAASGFVGPLMDLQMNGSSKFSVNAFGNTLMAAGGGYVSASGIQTYNGGLVGFTSTSSVTGTVDLALYRLGPANIRQGLAPSATPIAQTFTIGEASRPGTDSNVAGANGTIQSGLGTGTGTGSSLIFQTPTVAAGGSGVQTYATRLTLTGNQAIFTGSCATVNGYFVTAKSGWGSSVDGNIELYNSGVSSFGLLRFGGTTASFPAIKRNGATLECRLADDAGEADFRARVLVAGTAVQIPTSLTPASATAGGAVGQINWDNGFVYVCVATNTWKRAAIATW